MINKCCVGVSIPILFLSFFIAPNALALVLLTINNLSTSQKHTYVRSSQQTSQARYENREHANAPSLALCFFIILFDSSQQLLAPQIHNKCFLLLGIFWGSTCTTRCEHFFISPYNRTILVLCPDSRDPGLQLWTSKLLIKKIAHKGVLLHCQFPNKKNPSSEMTNLTNIV